MTADLRREEIARIDGPMSNEPMPCPACHHREHDPGACPECPRCELHVDEALIWAARVAREDYDEFVESIEADAIKAAINDLIPKLHRSLRGRGLAIWEIEAAIREALHDETLLRSQDTATARIAEAGKLLDKVIDAIEQADRVAEAADGPVGHVRDILSDDDWRVLYRRLIEARAVLSGETRTGGET